MVSYRGHADNPVQKVRVRGLDADGKITRGQTIGIWNLTPKEQERSEHDSVSHHFTQCVPCQSFTKKHTARFEVIAFDKNDNTSVQVIGVTPAANTFANCCPNLKEHPPGPVRRRK